MRPVRTQWPAIRRLGLKAPARHRHPTERKQYSMTSDSGTKKWVYALTQGDGKDRRLQGGKGANLCEMT
jgi:hypothetical protein